MKRRGSLGLKVSAGMSTLGLLALATAAPGCWVILGNDKDYREIDGGTGVGGAGSSSGSTGSGNPTRSSSAESSSSGMPGACNNPNDVMKLMDPNVAKMDAQACGQMCFGDPSPASCGASCMIMKLMISDPCSKCWGDVIACGIKTCAQPCLMGQMQCDACTAMKCEPVFHLCAGI